MQGKKGIIYFTDLLRFYIFVSHGVIYPDRKTIEKPFEMLFWEYNPISMQIIYQDANNLTIIWPRSPEWIISISITVYDKNTHNIFLENYSPYLVHFDLTTDFVSLIFTFKQVNEKVISPTHKWRNRRQRVSLIIECV